MQIGELQAEEGSHFFLDVIYGYTPAGTGEGFLEDFTGKIDGYVLV